MLQSNIYLNNLQIKYLQKNKKEMVKLVRYMVKLVRYMVKLVRYMNEQPGSNTINKLSGIEPLR